MYGLCSRKAMGEFHGVLIVCLPGVVFFRRFLVDRFELGVLLLQFFTVGVVVWDCWQASPIPFPSVSF